MINFQRPSWRQNTDVVWFLFPMKKPSVSWPVASQAQGEVLANKSHSPEYLTGNAASALMDCGTSQWTLNLMFFHFYSLLLGWVSGFLAILNITSFLSGNFSDCSEVKGRREISSPKEWPMRERKKHICGDRSTCLINPCLLKECVPVALLTLSC